MPFTLFRSSALLVAALSAVSCASTGPGSVQAKPVLYPNATFTRIGETAARAQVDRCVEMANKAVDAEQHRDTARKAGQAAATVAIAAAIGSLVGGGNSRTAVQNAAGSAATVGATVATAGAFEGGKANPTHRAFVQRCVSEAGLEIIGWQ